MGRSFFCGCLAGAGRCILVSKEKTAGCRRPALPAHKQKGLFMEEYMGRGPQPYTGRHPSPKGICLGLLPAILANAGRILTWEAFRPNHRQLWLWIRLYQRLSYLPKNTAGETTSFLLGTLTCASVTGFLPFGIAYLLYRLVVRSKKESIPLLCLFSVLWIVFNTVYCLWRAGFLFS